MKYLMLFLVLSLGVVSTACSQGKAMVPAAVETAFKAKFPDGNKAKWEQEGDQEWEAGFKMNGREMSANFNADGTWLETETEMKKADLPAAIKSAIATGFAGYKIEEAALVETPELAQAYEVELEKGEVTVEVLFDATGNVLKQETETEDGEDDGN